MERLSKRLSKWLLKTGAISDKEYELYEFAASSLFITLFPLFLSLSIGLFLGKVCESLFLILPFVLLRKFCGGYHLSSSLVCFTLSTALLVGCQLIGEAIQTKPIIIIFCLVELIMASIIYTQSPIDSEMRRLSQKENAVFKQVARKILVALFIVEGIMFYVGFSLWKYIGIGIILTAVLQLPCVLHIKQK